MPKQNNPHDRPYIISGDLGKFIETLEEEGFKVSSTGDVSPRKRKGPTAPLAHIVVEPPSLMVVYAGRFAQEMEYQEDYSPRYRWVQAYISKLTSLVKDYKGTE